MNLQNYGIESYIRKTLVVQSVVTVHVSVLV